jgi:hypothetical protein
MQYMNISERNKKRDGIDAKSRECILGQKG